MAPTSPSHAQEPARRSSSRKGKPAPRLADEPLAVVTKRPRAKKASTSGRKTTTYKPTRPSKAPRRKQKEASSAAADDDECAEEPDQEALADDEADEVAAAQEDDAADADMVGTRRVLPAKATSRDEGDSEFVGDPIPDDEARATWPKRYQPAPTPAPAAKKRKDEEEEYVRARRHYRAAKVEETVYNLGDDVFIRAEEGKPQFIGRLTEIFEGANRGHYFNCRWFFRPEDTVITNAKLDDDHCHDPKRVFLSDERDDNPLNCIVSKVKIVQVDPKLDMEEKAQLVASGDLYYDMAYTGAFSSFECIIGGTSESSGISLDVDLEDQPSRTTAKLLDLYSGCGGMSTGLCMGAELAGLKLHTRWAVDFNDHACNSLKSNHPQTEVWNQKADDFLSLIKEWARLCAQYVHNNYVDAYIPMDDEEEDVELENNEFVVEKLTEISFGGDGRKPCVYFKVQWEGYGRGEDTWEPIENLSDCPLKIREFVQEGYGRNILPLPGHVDVLCGGPPCQGVSGFNRFRNTAEPLKDEKNRQLVTFMDTVAYLRPKFVLMENVVDILKFADGFLGKYAMSRLVALSYQSRLGTMVAGSYGVPQYRMRAFVWGALPTMVLPKYALPTHDVVGRGGAPKAFSQNIVTYKETEKPSLKKALVLDDALSDLRKVDNDEVRDIIEYLDEPKTDFQRYIRRSRKEMLDYSFGDEAGPGEGKVLDHRPLKLNKNDYERVKQIPYRKGANFRDLKGVRVRPDNVVEFDPDIPRVYLDSRKPLVPNYAMKFVGGRSLKPFGRLWGDETVSTVVTRAEPHNQAVLHPDQPRVLTVRENARLQGFPDYYSMAGPIKQRYMQVGNAVAIPVARALGYSLGQAYLRKHDSGEDPLFVLPDNFLSPSQTEAVVRAASVGLPAEDVEEE